MPRSTLSMEQTLALYNWLVETTDRRTGERWSRPRCCKLARRELGFAVTWNNVDSVIAKSGGKLQMWDARDAHPLAGAAMMNHRITELQTGLEHRVAEMAAEVDKLRASTIGMLTDDGRRLTILERTARAAGQVTTHLQSRLNTTDGNIMRLVGMIESLDRRIGDLEGAIMAPGPVPSGPVEREGVMVPSPSPPESPTSATTVPKDTTAPQPAPERDNGALDAAVRELHALPFPARQRLAKALGAAARRAMAGGTVDGSLTTPPETDNG